MRAGQKIGDYLMVSDESGLTFYASEMRKRWDGAWVHVSEYEIRNPQDFVKARKDPTPSNPARTRATSPAACPEYFVLYVNGTTVLTPSGPASHLFDVGIGEAELGCNFVVR